MKIGMATPSGFWRQSVEERRQTVASAVANGVDHLFIADHVSFRDGAGTDGFVAMAALSQLHPAIGVMTSIYLLPLRHPLPVARQLATMQEVAPGRVIFGVGIGGEDRHEVEVCGVDPATRGRLTNESLAIIRGLTRGEEMSFDGEFFQIDNARIKPAIDPPTPIIVGGRSNAALRRAGVLGDGWVGTWCSVRRYAEALALIDASAADAGRTDVEWLHGYQPWIGIGDNKSEARERVSRAMEAFYKVPFEKFERYTPYGTPEEVASELMPYVDAGATLVNLKIVAPSDEENVMAAGVIAARLRRGAANTPSAA